MRISSDWHIHSRNSCDEAALTVADLIVGAGQCSITDFGLTDHLHTPYNLPDIGASRHEFLAASSDSRFHFGVEVSCVSQWELDEVAAGKHENPVYGVRTGGPPGASPAIGLTEEHVAAYGIEFVVAGAHWPLYVPLERGEIIRDYHRQNVFLAQHPLVDIVAHPWWWMGGWQDHDGRYTGDPWLDDFGKIPRSMHDEFAAVARENATVVEINLSAMLLNASYPERFRRQYGEYLAYLRTRGVSLAIGSDCHSVRYDVDFQTAAEMLSLVGFREDDFWCLKPRLADG